MQRGLADVAQTANLAREIGVEASPRHFRETAPAMIDLMLPLPGLSPVSSKTVVAKFDGGLLPSDGGILVLREAEQRLRVAERLAACIADPRSPDQITHSLADIIRFRLLMIAAGYEDGNDASNLRGDPRFKMALDLSPSDRELCSQSTISRLENLPDARVLLRMGRAMVDLYCKSFRQIPKRITLDIADTFDAAHGGQQLRFFNAHYYKYGFQPIVVFDGEGRFITTVLRPAKRPGARRSAHSCTACCGRCAPTGRTPRSCCAPTAIIAVPKFSTGVGPMVSITSWASRRPQRCAAYRGPRGQHEDALPGRAEGERQAPPLQGVLRRGQRIIARAEVGAEGPDTRFIVTNLKVRNARAPIPQSLPPNFFPSQTARTYTPQISSTLASLAAALLSRRRTRRRPRSRGRLDRNQFDFFGARRNSIASQTICLARRRVFALPERPICTNSHGKSPIIWGKSAERNAK